MKSNPRKAALTGLLLVEQGIFINQVLNEIFKQHQLSEQDRGLTTELIYGTTRMRGTLDYYLKRISRRPIAKLDPEVRNILRLGAYQILFLDRIPNSAAVNEAVKLAPTKNQRLVAGFINGVLRNLIRKQQQIKFPDLKTDPVAHISSKYSHPEWMVRRWVKRWGAEQVIKLCQFNNQPPELHLRVNTIKVTVEELQNYFAAKGIPTRPGRFASDVLVVGEGARILRDSYFQQGYYYVQNESSVLVGHALNPQPGEIVYDLCSAPGGKTTHLAQLMKNQGKIIAVDVTKEKIDLVKENAQQLGISIIETKVADAATIKLPLADKVLVDAPCSGLGTLAHRPDIRWSKSESDIVELSQIQRRILANAAGLVKPGGLLVYSTCTIEPEENQENLAWFLENFPSYRLKPLPNWFPGDSCQGYVSIMPFKHRIDGFFISLLENYG